MKQSESKEIFHPSTTEEVRQCVLAALGYEEPLEIMGSGSKRFYGRRVESRRGISLEKFSGILDYQPEELILVASPGTPLAEVERKLGEAGQMLAFDPPHWGKGATIGGIIACNLSGPRRVRNGAARDHFLGFEAVTGRGEIIRGGGKVMKNVTGYDLSKLMCGSFGTLAVLTEIILRVLPAPETERTVVATGLEEPEGIDFLIKAAGSPYDVSGLVHLPPGLKTPLELEGLAGNDKSLTLIRLEGPPPSVGYRCDKISGMIKTQAIFLETEDSASLWKGLREIDPLQVEPEERLWRISLPPSTSIGLVNGLRLASNPRVFYDWGAGLVWCALPEIYPARGLHRAAKDAGGHARIIRSGDGPTGEPLAFPPLDSVKMKLHQNLKEAFDPERVLNPGRMYEDL